MSAPVLFKRTRVRAHRERAASCLGMHDFFLREVAARMADKLADTTRTFPKTLILGSHRGILAKYLPDKSGITTLIQTDISAGMLADASGLCLVADDEIPPFKEQSMDAVLSFWSLHWVNDVPGSLAQIQRILKPGGMFIAAFAGVATLKELRASLEHAEMKLTGGISARISPFMDVKDGGMLLQRAGFSMPVADSETLTITYPNTTALIADLRGMGQTNAMKIARLNIPRRRLFDEASAYYRKNFSENGRLVATVELVMLTGWKEGK